MQPDRINPLTRLRFNTISLEYASALEVALGELPGYQQVADLSNPEHQHHSADVYPKRNVDIEKYLDARVRALTRPKIAPR